MWTCQRCGHVSTDDENIFCGHCGSARDNTNGSEYSLYLLSIDTSRKIFLIKTIREMTHLGLKEAKDLVDHAPQPVAMNLTRETANALLAQLQAAGAEAEVCPTGTPPSRPIQPMPPHSQTATGCTGIMLVVGILISVTIIFCSR